jgi:hypothetical protein
MRQRGSISSPGRLAALRTGPPGRKGAAPLATIRRLLKAPAAAGAAIKRALTGQPTPPAPPAPAPAQQPGPLPAAAVLAQRPVTAPQAPSSTQRYGRLDTGELFSKFEAAGQVGAAPLAAAADQPASLSTSPSASDSSVEHLQGHLAGLTGGARPPTPLAPVPLQPAQSLLVAAAGEAQVTRATEWLQEIGGSGALLRRLSSGQGKLRWQAADMLGFLVRAGIIDHANEGLPPLQAMLNRATRSKSPVGAGAAAGALPPPPASGDAAYSEMRGSPGLISALRVSAAAPPPEPKDEASAASFRRCCGADRHRPLPIFPPWGASMDAAAWIHFIGRPPRRPPRWAAGPQECGAAGDDPAPAEGAGRRGGGDQASILGR